jgi:hypothetical protein
MMPTRIAAALLAAGLAAHPALAQEYATYQLLEIPSEALQPCRNGMLVTLPEGWQAGDGAVVLVTMQQAGDAARDTLVSTLLYERAAVLEMAPVQCGGAATATDGVTAGAIDALDAMTRSMGSGIVVAIGYGAGSKAMLDVLRHSPDGPHAAAAPRYAAAVALGDGAPAFALGEPRPAQEDGPARLGALCRALAAVSGGMGTTPERLVPAAAAEACVTAMAGPAPAPVRTRGFTTPR